MRLRLNRTTLLLALVVLLLATVPVLVPLVSTKASGTSGARPAAPSGLPALPGPDDTAAASPPGALPNARSLAPTTATPPTPTTPSPSSGPTTPSPPSPPAARPPATTPPPAAPPPAPTAAPGPPAPTGGGSSAPTERPTVRAAGPDLVVVSVFWSPEDEELTAGQPVLFSALVRNAGADPTPEQTHGVAFSVDGTKVTWSAASTEPLAPGEERVYSADGGPDGPTWSATSGEHTVEAWVDDESRLPETDDGNNRSTTPLTVR